jgi:hypothetical protein
MSGTIFSLNVSGGDRIEFKVINAIQNDKTHCAASGIGDNVAGLRLILLVWRDINEIRVWNSKPAGVRDQGKWSECFWFKMFC